MLTNCPTLPDVGTMHTESLNINLLYLYESSIQYSEKKMSPNMQFALGDHSFKEQYAWKNICEHIHNCHIQPSQSLSAGSTRFVLNGNFISSSFSLNFATISLFKDS
jgi:hypothetical protein